MSVSHSLRHQRRPTVIQRDALNRRASPPARITRGCERRLRNRFTKPGLPAAIIALVSESLSEFNNNKKHQSVFSKVSTATSLAPPGRRDPHGRERHLRSSREVGVLRTAAFKPGESRPAKETRLQRDVRKPPSSRGRSRIRRMMD